MPTLSIPSDSMRSARVSSYVTDQDQLHNSRHVEDSGCPSKTSVNYSGLHGMCSVLKLDSKAIVL